MTPDEIRNISIQGDTSRAKEAFALSMLQEIAAQLAEINQTLRKAHGLKPIPPSDQTNVRPFEYKKPPEGAQVK